MWTHAPRGLKALLVALTAVGCGASATPDALSRGGPGASASPDALSPSGPDASTALAALTADSAIILDDLRFLASDELQGRATGSEGAALARSRLTKRFAEIGLKAVGNGFEHAFTWTRRNEAEPRTGVNVLGVMQGTELPDRYIVVSGHYDHVGVRNGEIYNGADDNASGAVGVTALARALQGAGLRHSVIFVSFDGEESGLRGAHAFVAAPPVPLDAIAVDVNMDMVARTAGVLWAGGAHRTPALRPILEDVARRAPLDYRLGHDAPGAPEGDDWTYQSDQGPFNDAGIPWVYLGVEDHPDYHHPTDDFERVDPGEYMNALRAALLTVLALDEALPLSSAPPTPPTGPTPTPESLP